MDVAEINRPVPKMPGRLSAAPLENRKPSKLVAAFWWFVFIVPLVFVWFAFKSPLYIGILIGLRIVVMFLPIGKAKPVPAATQSQEACGGAKAGDNSLSIKDILSLCKDEAIAEWWGLLKFLHVYDRNKEERYYEDYRKLMGWDK
jgi:hypothetical protein